jgi:pimeloyl-ACP methyl ester carboxylesterase
METTSQYIIANNIKLHVVTAGREDGEPVLLLHGFPEYWYGWRNQISFLVEHGYRVIVPDQRGYHLSEKPQDIDSYRISTLAADVNALIEHFGYEKVNLVGHDWGAAVAWMVATIYPERLKKLVILNVPYPSIMARAFFSGNVTQLLKSWYMFFFQIPWLPEAILSVGGYDGFANAIRSSGKPDTFSDEDIEKYKEAWLKPGAITGMLNWYRAMLQRRGSGSSTSSNMASGERDLPRITVPTLILWGEKDIALEKSLAEESLKLCENGKIVFFPDATHWLQHDEAAAVNQHLHEFLQPAGV